MTSSNLPKLGKINFATLAKVDLSAQNGMERTEIDDDVGAVVGRGVDEGNGLVPSVQRFHFVRQDLQSKKNIFYDEETNSPKQDIMILTLVFPTLSICHQGSVL